MALVKTVEMRVLADAGDAQAKLDELDAKAKGLESGGIRMRFRVDDAEGKAQLDGLRAQADRLGFKDVSIRVRVDGAGRAIAELQAVRAEEDHASKSGLLSRIGGSIGGFFGGSGPMGGGGGMPGGALVAALPAILPVAAAALVEVTGLVSGFAAAGVGAAAFAALAMPAVKKVESAYSGLNAAQQKYAQAQALEAAAPSKAHASALAAAAVGLEITHKAISKMPATEQGAIKGIQGLTSEYGKMSKAFQPQVFKIFNDGLKVANHLLPAITPFANTFANSLDGLLKKADKFTQSKGFAGFLKQFHSIEGPAVTAIGEGIGKIATSFGKLITTMSGKDVASTIKLAFNVISGSISGVAFVVAHLMSSWDTLSGTAKRDTHQVAAAFDALRHDVATAGHDIASTFDGIRHGAASMADSMVHTIAGLPGKILGVFSDAGAWLVHAGQAIIDGLIHGIEARMGSLLSTVGSIAGFIASHKGPIEYDRQLLVPHGQAIMDGLMGGMSSRMSALAGQLHGVSSMISGSVAPGRGGGGDHYEINIHSLQTSSEIARTLVQTLREYKRNGGGATLGIA